MTNMKFLAFIAVLLHIVSCQLLSFRFNLNSVESLLEEEWMEFKLLYNKTYNTPEQEQLRREIYIENRRKIAVFNQGYSFGRSTFVQQLNNYADMLQHEFNNLLNGYNRNLRDKIRIPAASTFIPSANVQIPESIDWREVGAVTSVKYQANCAGCWAFAAAGALEGQNFRKTGRLTELSVQNLLDCNRDQGNEGCQGGLIQPAFEYVRVNPGIDTWDSYPFEGRDGQCRFRPEAVGSQCSGYVEITPGDEKALELAVATIGPIAAAMDAGRDTFQFYSNGVYADAECSNSLDQLNHAVLVVGYGVEPNGQKYWLIKNSYGPTWGIGGYFKLAKDQGNQCGIATEASYPLV